MKTLIALLLSLPLTLGAAEKLRIYWIDVEGGAATLIVTAAGETVLMDAGYRGFDGRDTKRIHHVLSEEAHVEKIDVFITSHFHGDHVGGLPALAKLVPIGRFLDHGDSIDKDSERGGPLWERYLEVVGDRRGRAAPGDKIDLAGVELTIVASNNERLSHPLGPAGENPLCRGAETKSFDPSENGKSVGYLLRAGKFEFLNLGDLHWSYQHLLACPANLIGEVDLFQTPHHGVRDDMAPQLVGAIKPLAVVMNNGPRKGGGAAVYEHIVNSAGADDLWQVHRSLANDDAHNTAEQRTGNLGESKDCAGHWIRAVVDEDGSFAITNSRNGFSKSYQAR